MENMESKSLQSYIEALQNLVSSEDKSSDKVLQMLKVALADEWLAAYQYWVCKNLVRGEGRSDVMPEFEQHYKDELQHADEIMLRIKELGGEPIFNPTEWIKIANPWTQVNMTSACQQLDITIKAQEDAIKYYNEIIEYCKGEDEVTMRLCRSILSDETQHLYDLQMLKEQICG